MGKGVGCLTVICSLYLIGGIASEVSLNSFKKSGDSWFCAYYRSKGVNLLTWPKMFFCDNHYEKMEFKENYFNTRRKLNIIKNSIDSSSPQYTQISSLEKGLDEGDIVIENAERQIESIGDAFLGYGKSAQIINIVEGTQSGQITQEQAARKLMNLVPSNFSRSQEGFAREAANRILTNILQQPMQKTKKPYSEE